MHPNSIDNYRKRAAQEASSQELHRGSALR
jgi:hypothetical protein